MRDSIRSGGPDPRATVAYARRLARGFGALVALTFGLIVLGGLVRAHEAGLACPDWPRCFGRWIPPMDLRVAFEWTHRLVAGTIALAFVVLALFALRHPSTRRATATPLAIGALLLAVQIVLGGLTVLLGLAPWTVTSHLVAGNAFAVTLLVTTLALREQARPLPRTPVSGRTRSAVVLVAALLVAQVVLGGLVSSTYAGLACPEWPRCNGGIWFPSWRGSVGLHLAHRTNAYLLILALGAAAWTARRERRVALALRLGCGLALAQTVVGVANVWLGIPVEVTGLHSALAAGLVLTLAHAVREAFVRPRPLAGAGARVVVVGAGFGGLALVHALRDAPFQVLLVDRHNYHTFLPLLYQVATSGLGEQDITRPVRTILRRVPNARFRMIEVSGVRLDERRLETVDGGCIEYDVLVLAAGGTTEYFANRSIENHAFRLHRVEDALSLRNQILDALERADAATDAAEREGWLGFVVVGGGATGLELAGMLAELRRHVFAREFARVSSEMRILLLEGQERLLPALPQRLSRRALEQIRELGVEVRLGALVDEVDREGVRLRGGERLRARTVVWAAGVRGAPLGEALGIGVDGNGRIPVEPTLTLPGHPNVFVIGDLARVPGTATPQVAPVAVQQGRLVAENLKRRLLGEPPLPFVYRDPGTLATIGRNRAVAHFFGLQLSGRPAWWAWLLVHLVKLAGFRNRAVVFVNWIYHYFTYDLGLRAIVGPRREPVPEGAAGDAPLRGGKARESPASAARH